MIVHLIESLIALLAIGAAFWYLLEIYKEYLTGTLKRGYKFEIGLVIFLVCHITLVIRTLITVW